MIRALDGRDVDAFIELRREALHAAPLAFGASPEDDRGLSPEFVTRSVSDPDSSAIFGAFAGAEMTGCVGVFRPEKLKWRHKAMIWGMYVRPGARGQGLGHTLLRTAIDRARSWPGVRMVHLSVTEGADAARRLYEGVGFHEWGHEPRAVGWDGTFVDEHHYVLDLGD